MIEDRPVVCVQALGFVGAAMATAVALARNDDGTPAFHVVGVDLATPAGERRIAAINRGEFPFSSNDRKLGPALAACRHAGNLEATSDPAVFSRASVVIVDVNLDISTARAGPTAALEPFRAAISTVGRHMPPDALVIVETTVPPGTTERVVAPALAKALADRGLPTDRFLIAHAYERVMPGDAYLDSIIHFWRVYAGLTPKAADAAERFLSRVIDVAQFPLTRLSSVTASETAKALENSYRATTIAFMEEWGRFAEAVGVDMFEIVQAIRVRPTHSNMRTPGFGVGGYCLTKDPLFAGIGARELFGKEVPFPFCEAAVRANAESPLHTVARLREMVGPLEGRTILLLGVGYRPDVGDTRFSPSQRFVEVVEAEGGTVVLHDPLVGHWDELDREVPKTIPSTEGIDAVVFAVAHREYRDLDLVAWMAGRTPAILDANGVLSKERRATLRAAGCRVASVGRGTDQ
jgi:UDP-N-acetyl-D-glucosamine dehydrogenase